MNVSKLFTKQQWRELELIAYLTDHPNKTGVKDRELSKVLDSTILTLQASLANLQLMSGIGKVHYEDSYLKIEYYDNCGLQEVYQKALRESQALKLMSILFFKEFASLEDLAEELFISLSTLKRLITRTNSYLKKEFNIFISTRPISVVGNEHNIRLFYLKYFSEAYTITEWPFESYLNKKNHERLISLLVEKTSLNINFALFQHLKIVSGVNLIRFQKGYRINEYNNNQGKLLLNELENSKEMKDLSSLFRMKFNYYITEDVLTELFSNYLDERLELGISTKTVASSREVTPSPYILPSWIAVLDSFEKKLNLSISNKYNLAVHLHATVILGQEDIGVNFLVYDYKQNYLALLRSQYETIYSCFLNLVEDLYDKNHILLDSDLRDNLLYCFFITWENFYLEMRRKQYKLKVLVIERSYNNTGNFLKRYVGEFFEVTNFEELEVMDIDLVAIAEEYDLIVTDVIIERVEGAEILFFNRMIPTLVADRLNDYLRLNTP